MLHHLIAAGIFDLLRGYGLEPTHIDETMCAMSAGLADDLQQPDEWTAFLTEQLAGISMPHLDQVVDLLVRLVPEFRFILTH